MAVIVFVSIAERCVDYKRAAIGKGRNHIVGLNYVRIHFKALFKLFYKLFGRLYAVTLEAIVKNGNVCSYNTVVIRGSKLLL
jgi:hypothetical protein